MARLPHPAATVTEGNLGSDGCLSNSAFNGKQHVVAVDPRKSYHLLEFETKLLKEPYGTLIFGQGNAEYGRQFERAKAVFEHSTRNLECEASGPVLTQERKSNVRVV
jgi:hypothetical protein